jgi:hypothetical protein
MPLNTKEQGTAKAVIRRELKKSPFVTDWAVFIVFIIGAGIALLGFSLHVQKERNEWLRTEQIGIDMNMWRRKAATPLEWHGYEMLAAQERGELDLVCDDHAVPENLEDPGSVFESISATLPFAPPIVQRHLIQRYPSLRNKPKDDVEKPDLQRAPCRVYVVGSASHVSMNFVLPMHQDARCSVHVFECGSRRPKLAREDRMAERAFRQALAPLVTFHDWCIGQQNSNFVEKVDSGPSKTLVDTMVELGHLHVDLLKLNMQGLEWQFFETEILPLKSPPMQLDFSLHTEGTTSDQIYQSLVKGKGFPQVNRLFRGLYRSGYLLASKKAEVGDPASAEFILIQSH